MRAHLRWVSRSGETAGKAILCWSLAWCLGGLAPAAAQDLTGIWRDEHGGRYVIRQAGDELCWYFEPINVFCGTVIGDTIAGHWLDLPSGPYRFSGHLVLRIQSPDRLVKVYETMDYGSSVWTREGSATAGPSSPANPSTPPAVPSAPLPPSPASGGAGPTSGTRPAASDENGGTKDWTYRAIGDDYRGRISQSPGAPSQVIEGGTIALTGAVAFNLRGQYGTRVRVTCPAGGSDIGYLWGTDVYTDDSITCSAAVHAGLITFAKGGTVTLEIRPGQSSYQGSTRFGVTSKGFGAYEGSFVFVH